MDEPVPIRTGRCVAFKYEVGYADNAERVLTWPSLAVKMPCLAKMPKEIGSLFHLLRLIRNSGILPIVWRSEGDVAIQDGVVHKALLGDHGAEDETAHGMRHYVHRHAVIAFFVEVHNLARYGLGNFFDSGSCGEAKSTTIVA